MKRERKFSPTCQTGQGGSQSECDLLLGKQTESSLHEGFFYAQRAELFRIAKPGVLPNSLNRRNKMETLRCRIGDLAISIGCYLPENTGNVVRIIGVEGYQTWYGITGQTFVWIVEVTQQRPLVYENADGSIYTLLIGPVPDQFLIPISSGLDLQQLPFDIAEEAIKESERLLALKQKQESERTPNEPYDPISNCMKQHPGLTEEDIRKMAEEMGF